MNILLMTARVNSPADSAGLASHMPYGLGYIAATLKRHSSHEATILDLPHSGLDDDQVVALIAERGFDLVGISAVMANYRFCVDFTGRLRRRFPGLTIVLGGALPTTMPDIVSQDCAVDFVVRGPGELALLDIANGGLAAGGAGAPRIVEGRLPASIDDIPWPDWDLMGYRSYRYLPPWSDFPILSSRGCPFSCNYCYKINGNGFKERGLDAIFAEMRHVVEVLGFDHFMMQDDLFFLKPERVKRLCRMILDHGLKAKWSAVSRIDLLDEEAIACLREAGCFAVAVGIESGSQRMLDAMNKRLSLAKTTENIALLHRHGLRIMPYIIVGYPGETAETLAETRDFLIKNRIYSAMTYAFPLPGTRLWDVAVQRGMIRDTREYLDRPSFNVSRPHFNFTAMPDRELEERVEAMKAAVVSSYIDGFISPQAARSVAGSIFIYGSGHLGQGVCRRLSEDVEVSARIAAFIDDDPLRIGGRWMGREVVALEAARMGRDDLCVVANSYFPDVMVGNLRRIGFAGTTVVLA